MALACPFCSATILPEARLCRACGLNIVDWLSHNPGKSIPGWVGPAAASPVAARTAAAPADDGHPEFAERWPRAALLFVFCVLQLLMARFMSDLAAGATGTDAFQRGAYGASALYGALGFGALAGWSLALWAGFAFYAADSLYHVKLALAAGGAARIGMTVLSRFVFARLIYRTAKHS